MCTNERESEKNVKEFVLRIYEYLGYVEHFMVELDILLRDQSNIQNWLRSVRELRIENCFMADIEAHFMPFQKTLYKLNFRKLIRVNLLIMLHVYVKREPLICST